MSLGNRWRERKHDHDDRGSECADNSLLQHRGPMAPQVDTRYRRGTGNSIPECGRPAMVIVRYIVTDSCGCFSVSVAERPQRPASLFR
jgi:hypothetical protein